jgi:glycosyltransferase involved in cell wall biosynthesis
MRVAFVSVVPSPYQRDLFAALSQRPEIDLSVFYLEAAAPDSPWPKKPLAPYERILPGTWFSIGSARCHWNWPLPRLDGFEVVVMNTLMSFTGQWLMRLPLRGRKWFFWGEKLNSGGALHRMLAAPLHRAAAIAAIGSAADRDYRIRFPRPLHFCIPYFCSLDSFQAAPRRKRDDGQTVFLFCGQMIGRKGVDTLLAAFQQLDERARLLLVGREAELPPMLAAIPVKARERCVYAGFEPPEELPRLFSQADVFVLPSRYDGWGVVVNQAIGAGLPVICSDMVGAGHDLVQDGVNGFTFRAGDAVALAGKMRRFMNEPGCIDQMGAASRAKAPLWTPAAGAELWVQAFHEVVGK